MNNVDLLPSLSDSNPVTVLLNDLHSFFFKIEIAFTFDIKLQKAQIAQTLSLIIIFGLASLVI